MFGTCTDQPSRYMMFAVPRCVYRKVEHLRDQLQRPDDGPPLIDTNASTPPAPTAATRRLRGRAGIDPTVADSGTCAAALSIRVEPPAVTRTCDGGVALLPRLGCSNDHRRWDVKWQTNRTGLVTIPCWSASVQLSASPPLWSRQSASPATSSDLILPNGKPSNPLSRPTPLTLPSATSTGNGGTPTTQPATKTTTPGGRIASQPPPDNIYNQFELVIDPGYSYGLDLPPGASPSSARAVQWTPGVHDLYRAGNPPTDQFSGIPNSSGSYNGIQAASASATTATSARETPVKDGNVKVATLRLHSKICIRTASGRGALLEVVELSDDKTVLQLHITVAN